VYGLMKEEHMTFATADLMDQPDDRFGVCEMPLRQYGGQASFHGHIRTVRCLEDNVILRGLLAEPGDGQVLVVDGGGSLRTALLGDLIAGSAVENGWAGIVVNGAVRDVAVLRTLRIGIVALGSNPRRSGKAGAGELDVPTSFGGVTFLPGAKLYADEDGMIVELEVGSAEPDGAEA
jgi:regulator of ribonuclease activity A